VPPPADIINRMKKQRGTAELDAHETRLLAALSPVADQLAVVATRPVRDVESAALDLVLGALLPALIALAVAVGSIALLLQRSVLLPLRLMADGLEGTTPVAAASVRRTIPRELAAIWDRVGSYQQQVQERQDRLTDALAARTELMREVHHRTKNNLQIVSSLLALQERRNEEPRVAAELRTARERIATLATLHQQLYAGSGVERMDSGQFLRDLVRGIARAGGADARGIRIRVNAEPVPLHMDQAGPLGLIVNELVTNSLKYAFEGRANGMITVTAGRRGDRLEVVVADDGIGLPGDGLPDGGLGGRLMAAFTRQLQGRLERRAVPGTVIALSFPLFDGEHDELETARAGG
jgi:two-component sensor histidine kinase